MTRINLDDVISYGLVAKWFDQVFNGENLGSTSTERVLEWYYSTSWTTKESLEFLANSSVTYGVSEPFVSLGQNIRKASGIHFNGHPRERPGNKSWPYNGDERNIRSIMLDQNPTIDVASQYGQRNDRIFREAFNVPFIRMEFPAGLGARRKGRPWYNEPSSRGTTGPQMAVWLQRKSEIGERNLVDPGIANMENMQQSGDLIADSNIRIAGSSGSATELTFDWAALTGTEFSLGYRLEQKLTTSNEIVSETQTKSGQQLGLKTKYTLGPKEKQTEIEASAQFTWEQVEKYSFKETTTSETATIESTDIKISPANFLENGIFTGPDGKQFQLENGKRYTLTFEFLRGSLDGNVNNTAVYSGVPETNAQLKTQYIAYSGPDGINTWELNNSIGAIYADTVRLRGDLAYNLGPNQIVRRDINSIAANNIALASFNGTSAAATFTIRETIQRKKGEQVIDDDNLAYIDEEGVVDRLTVDGSNSYIVTEDGSDSVILNNSARGSLIRLGNGNDRINATGASSVWMGNDKDQAILGKKVRVNLGEGLDTARVLGNRNTLYLEDLDNASDHIDLSRAGSLNVINGFGFGEDMLILDGRQRVAYSNEDQVVTVLGRKATPIAEIHLELGGHYAPGTANSIALMGLINYKALSDEAIEGLFARPFSSASGNAIARDLITGAEIVTINEFAEFALQQADPGEWALRQVFDGIKSISENASKKELSALKDELWGHAASYFTPDAFSGGDSLVLESTDLQYALDNIMNFILPMAGAFG